PFAAAWLRELIKAELIAHGDVDERSIEDVQPSDLAGYTQCHFFAGIGGWGHALRLAGWPDDRPVWTGSCPCQPFSSTGKRAGFADERHLWPALFHLICQCRPDTIFGEQVASKDGLVWLDLVQSDLEGARYAVGAADTCAAGYGSPHIRQRLYWVAHSLGEGLEGFTRNGYGAAWGAQALRPTPAPGVFGGLVDTAGSGRTRGCPPLAVQGRSAERGGPSAQPICARKLQGQSERLDCSAAQPTQGFWRDADWLLCRDGKYRPVESGTYPLAHGIPARVGRLRGYGNAIVAPQAEAFVRAFLEVEANYAE
ncbi:MAG: DNA cytosine methyltransferase, partial [Desulfovibrio sp.]|nr:DNA cytosine methyltransferase [Desulfovibrio sp.]